VALVRDQQLKSPELTGEWEAKLNRIEAGQAVPGAFMHEIVEYTRQIIRSSDETAIDQQKLGDCPRCGQPVIQGKRGVGCSAWRDGCRFVLWPTYKDYQLDMQQLRSLLQHGVTSEPIRLGDAREFVLAMLDSGELVEIPVPQGDEQKSGKSSGLARRKRQSAPKTKAANGLSRPVAENPPTDLAPCPLCGAKVIEQKKSFSCSRWRDGCSLTIWKTISGKRISARTAKALLRDGATSVLKGFKSKSGQPFNARLKLQEGKVTFEFDS